MRSRSQSIFLPVFRLVTVLLLAALTGMNDAHAVTVAPSAWASIHDGPIDGGGDGFNSDSGLLASMVAGLPAEAAYKDIVIVEYDLSPFAGQTLAEVTLDFEVEALDLAEPQLRAFDLFTYSGNGTADLGDFSRGATYVDTVGYTVGTTGSFSIDVLAEAEAILAGGGAFLGVRVDPIGSRNPASLIAATAVLNVSMSITPIPEPATILVLGLGSAVLLRKRRS